MSNLIFPQDYHLTCYHATCRSRMSVTVNHYRSVNVFYASISTCDRHTLPRSIPFVSAGVEFDYYLHIVQPSLVDLLTVVVLEIAFAILLELLP